VMVTVRVTARHLDGPRPGRAGPAVTGKLPQSRHCHGHCDRDSVAVTGTVTVTVTLTAAGGGAVTADGTIWNPDTLISRHILAYTVI
jgi:hypothetical protein